MNQKFLNIRIGVDFYNKLISHPAFESNYKCISGAFYFLGRIATLNDMAEGKPVEFYSTNIYGIFKPYCKTSEGQFAYKKYLNALEDLKLLTVNNSYVVGDDDIEGACKMYLVSDECADLLSSSNVEYLKKLHDDPKVARLNQQAISERKVMHSTYSDYVLDYISDGLKHFNYDYEKVMTMVTGSGWSPMTQQSAEQSLIAFKTKDFGDLKYNEKDGRVFNEFVAMKSDLRAAFNYKKMKRMAVIDIRACHPTFFSSYILDLWVTKSSKIIKGVENIRGSEKTESKASLLSPHYVQAKPDISDNICENAYNKSFEALKQEHQKWLLLFTNPEIDPRDVIGSEVGKTKQEIKDALNQVLNGSKRHPRVVQWIEKNFPYLFEIWQSTDVSQTGCDIARQYESKVMLHPEIYKQAESQGLKIAYEYDGVSIFSSDVVKSILIAKVEYLAKRIKYLAEKECGAKMVIKVEFQDSMDTLFPL